MYYFLLSIFLLTSISLILLILLQKNKSFEINSLSKFHSPELIGVSIDSRNVIEKITIFFSILFFILSLILGNLSSKIHEKNCYKKLEQDLNNKEYKK